MRGMQNIVLLQRQLQALEWCFLNNNFSPYRMPIGARILIVFFKGLR